jgi:hypothetical protein
LGNLSTSVRQPVDSKGERIHFGQFAQAGVLWGGFSSRRPDCIRPFFLANRKSASGIDLSQKRNEGGGSAEGSRRPFGLTQNYFILGKLPGRGCEGVVFAARLFRGPPLWAEAREPTPLNLKYEPRRDLHVAWRPGAVRLPKSQVGLLA